MVAEAMRPPSHHDRRLDVAVAARAPAEVRTVLPLRRCARGEGSRRRPAGGGGAAGCAAASAATGAGVAGAAARPPAWLGRPPVRVPGRWRVSRDTRARRRGRGRGGRGTRLVRAGPRPALSRRRHRTGSVRGAGSAGGAGGAISSGTTQAAAAAPLPPPAQILRPPDGSADTRRRDRQDRGRAEPDETVGDAT